MLASIPSLHAQISITNGSPLTENFDAMGTSGTASLPANWKMSAAGAAAPTWSAAGNFTAVTQGASSGSPPTGGRYNWGQSTLTSDRAAGFMTSGGYASPNSVMAYYVNNTGGTITDLAIAFDIERYRINTAAASVTFFTSTDGTTWTAQAAGDSGAFSTGTSAYTFTGGTVINKSFSLTGLSITNNSPIYLRWNFSTVGANSQGLGLDNMSLSATFSGDSTPPTIATYTPANGATGVNPMTNLVAQFSESISKGTGDITVKLISDNSTVFTIPVTDAAVAVSGSTATITLPSSLGGTTAYYVNIAAGAFKDPANNNFAGISDSATWTFTTASLDLTPPAITTLSPADNSSSAFPNGVLSVSYDENIVAGTGTLVIKKSLDDSVVETIPVPGSLVTISGATATINPSSILQYGTGYYVEIAAGTFKDAVNNGTTAVTGNSTWNFITRSSPQVVISQYYEGTGTDRYIELKNLTGSPVALTGYRLACWSDSAPSDNEGWKSGSNTTLRITDLTSYTIPANGSFLVAENGATSPAYAANNTDLFNPTGTPNGTATSFNGDDSVVLYNGSGFTQDEVVDAISFSANQGTDLSIYRISDTLQGFDFVTGTSFLNFTGTWATKTLAQVNSAALTDDWYLKATQPPKVLTLSIVSPSFSEGAGATAATGTISVATPVASDFFITVESSDLTEATVPGTVTIPMGQSSASFPITAVNDAFLDGNKNVTITVSAGSYTPDSKVVTVEDELTDINVPVVINEVDCDQNATDTAEFIELYNNSASPVTLDGVVLVLYNGSSDLSYQTIDLTGKTIAAHDYFVIGSANVPNVDMAAFIEDGIQNGADAVALYLGNPSDFPNNTAATTTSGPLVDALVYGTNDAADSGLINALTPGKPQVDEGATSVLSIANSMSRIPDGGAPFNSSLYVSQTPTPGATNIVAGYSGWASANSTSQTINQDHDGDGVSNGVEFFLGGNTVTTGFTATPGVVNTSGTLSITWTKAADYTGTYGTDFVVETSSSLAAGSWTTETLGVNVVITGNNVKYTFPAGSKNFARLRVTGP